MSSVTFTTFPRTNQAGLFIEIPGEVLAALGTKKRLPVHATLNNVAYRTTVAVYDDRYYLPVRKEIREAAGLKVNDPVTVTLVADTEPRTVEVPDDLTQAFTTGDAITNRHVPAFRDQSAAFTGNRAVEGAKQLLALATNSSCGLSQ